MNENHDEPNGEAAEDVTPHGEPKTVRKRFEDERMTRREALRKIGLTMGMATFAMLSVDDLARFSAKKLQEHEVSKGIGDTLANEFRSAGVAFANPSGWNPPNPSGPPPNPSGQPPNPSGPPSCKDNCDTAHDTCVAAANAAYANIPCGPFNVLCPGYTERISQCDSNRWDCYEYCNSPHPPNPSGPPFDPTLCQDRCDGAVIQHLQDDLGDGFSEIGECLSGCTDSDPYDQAECMRGCVSGHGNTATLLKTKHYIECCYLACDVSLEGPDICKW